MVRVSLEMMHRSTQTDKNGAFRREKQEFEVAPTSSDKHYRWRYDRSVFVNL
jgi:hypothetical protein